MIHHFGHRQWLSSTIRNFFLEIFHSRLFCSRHEWIISEKNRLGVLMILNVTCIWNDWMGYENVWFFNFWLFPYRLVFKNHILEIDVSKTSWIIFIGFTYGNKIHRTKLFLIREICENDKILRTFMLDIHTLASYLVTIWRREHQDRWLIGARCFV